MKVYNQTDIETAVLAQRGLVNQCIVVAGSLINPGEFAEVEDTAKARADLEYLLTLGAVAIDNPSPPYVALRAQLEASKSGGRKSQHLDVKETKPAGETAPLPPADGTTVTLEKEDMTKLVADPPPEPPAPEVPKTSKNRR